jgi:hypothetical protein
MTKKTIILLCFIIAKFIIQYSLIDKGYDLHRDEYLHLDQANHLAWGYVSVPPVTSWISFLISLLGNGLFWVKFFPALFGALTIVAVWKIIEALDGSLFALVLGATSILLSVILRINTLYQPNSLEILLWTVFYLFVLRYTKSNSSKWLYYAAIAFAFGFLNKYNFIFLMLGLFPAVLLSRQRMMFANKQFYYAAALALLLISPNLIWQYQNGFPVVHHLNELARTQLVNVQRANFLKEQLLFFFGALFVIISALVALLVYEPFKPYRLFLFSFIFTLAIFVYFKAKGYYAIGLYPLYIGIGAAYLGAILKTGWKKYLQPVAIALPVIFFIPLFIIAFPTKTPQEIVQHPGRYKAFGLLRWEDGKDHALPQDFADMLGWKELAAKVDTAYASIAAKGETLVLCDNYGQAGAINYYTKNKKIKAVSFNADYINWFKLDVPIKNLVRIKEAEDSGTELKETAPYFEKAFVAGAIKNSFAREYGTSIFVFIGSNTDVNARIKKEIAEVKSRW